MATYLKTDNVSFTFGEVLLLRALRTNCFNDLTEDNGESVWTDIIVEESGISPSAARGILSSLVQKQVLFVSGGKDSVIELLDNRLEDVRTVLDEYERILEKR